MHYVFSTIASDMVYATYHENSSKELAQIDKKVLIRGKAHIIDKVFHTPIGAVTKVTDEELATLESIPLFKQHREQGYIRVERKKIDIDTAVTKMTPKDPSAQKVKEDFKDKFKAQPYEGSDKLSMY